MIKKKLYWPKNILLTKNLQFYSNLADILAILSTHELIILTKFDEDQTKIVDFLLALYFWSSIIFFESVSTYTSWEEICLISNLLIPFMVGTKNISLCIHDSLISPTVRCMDVPEMYVALCNQFVSPIYTSLFSASP